MAPQTSVPPSLPPSVEEAYRRKCVQLKNRTNEVEESNHAARLRLARIKRQVEKMRLERAFLLEQLAKRTSANVEDSEGSPSPPPTPKDKPLRIKRGHRKASIGGDADSKSGAPGDATELGDGSPSKKAAASRKQRRRRSQTNGVSPAPPPLPATVFDMFADEKREEAAKKSKGEGSSADAPNDADLEAEWKDLSEEDKAAVEKRYEELKEKIRKHEEEVAQGEADAEAEAEAEAEEEEAEAEAEAEEAAAAAAADAATPRPTKSSSEPKAESKSPAPEKAPAATQDEDVEMADNDNDTEDGDMQVDKDGDA